MGEQWVVHLPCAGEFIAVLQIENAMLGRGRLPRWASVALAEGMWILTQALWGDYQPFSVWAIAFNGLRFLAASFLFGGTIPHKIRTLVICGVSILGYENLVGALIATVWHIPLSEAWRIPYGAILYGVITNAVVWLVIQLLKRSFVPMDFRQRLAANAFLCVAAAMNCVLAVYGQELEYAPMMLLICTGMTLSVAAYFALLNMFSAQTLQASRIQGQIKMEQERSDALMESYRTQRRLTHDFANHMDAVGFYLNRGDIQGAKAYLAGISQKVAAGTAVVNTNHPLLDALLTREYRKAAQKGAILQFDLCDLRQFPLSDTDLATVMCNLLDNAVEAAAAADPPQIQLRIRRLEGEYIVSVRNRVARDVEVPKGSLPATTKTGQGHGMGMANVCSVLDRSGGEYTISCRDRWFCFTFTLPAGSPAEQVGFVCEREGESV